MSDLTFQDQDPMVFCPKKITGKSLVLLAMLVTFILGVGSSCRSQSHPKLKSYLALGLLFRWASIQIFALWPKRITNTHTNFLGIKYLWWQAAAVCGQWWKGSPGSVEEFTSGLKLEWIPAKRVAKRQIFHTKQIIFSFWSHGYIFEISDVSQLCLPGAHRQNLDQRSTGSSSTKSIKKMREFNIEI